MAIKGKRKSQTRGSQARRRPAAAPRPLVTARHTPWYRTQVGRGLLLLLAVVVTGLGWWAYARAQDRREALELRQSAFETYTRNIQALLQEVRPPVEAMAGFSGAGDEQMDALADDVPRWTKSLEEAQTEAGRIFSGPSTAPAHALFQSSIGSYLSAAKTYGLAAEATGKVRVNALARAAEQRDAATSVWVGATQVLDRERVRAELDPSGLGAPATPPAGAATGPALPGTEDAPGG